jgi:hypothetical protein
LLKHSAVLADEDVSSHLVSRRDDPGPQILIPPVSHSHKEHVRSFQVPICVSFITPKTVYQPQFK